MRSFPVSYHSSGVRHCHCRLSSSCSLSLRISALRVCLLADLRAPCRTIRDPCSTHARQGRCRCAGGVDGRLTFSMAPSGPRHVQCSQSMATCQFRGRCDLRTTNVGILQYCGETLHRCHWCPHYDHCIVHHIHFQ